MVLAALQVYLPNALTPSITSVIGKMFTFFVLLLLDRKLFLFWNIGRDFIHILAFYVSINVEFSRYSTCLARLSLRFAIPVQF